MKKNNLSNKDDLLIQSYFTVAFLRELNHLNFLNSEYYNNIQFQDRYLYENLPSIGIGNRGALIIFLFALLVIPHEQFKGTDLEKKFEEINKTIKSLSKNESSTYKKDIHDGVLDIQYLYHIRNAVAHMRIEFIEDKVRFTDENKPNKLEPPKEECSFELALSDIGMILTELQMQILRYLQTKK